MFTRLGKNQLYLALFAALLFNNWLLGLVFNWPEIKKGGSISELSSAHQPAHYLFQVLDISAGILILVLAFSLKNSIDLKRRSGRWLTGGLTILGVANIVDAFLPLPCSGTLSPTCNAPVHLGLHGFSVPAHAYSSTIIGIFFLVLPLLSIIYYKSRLMTISSLITMLATVLFFIFLLAESARGSYSGSAGAGFTQQIQTLIFGGWLVVWAKTAVNLEH
jgi:hypothetical protein